MPHELGFSQIYSDSQNKNELYSTPTYIRFYNNHNSPMQLKVYMLYIITYLQLIYNVYYVLTNDRFYYASVLQ